MATTSSRYWLTTLLTVAVVASTTLLQHGDASRQLEVRGTSFASATGAEPLVIAEPEGTQQGDLLVAVVVVNGPSATTPTSGWELVRTDSRGGELTQAMWTRTVKDLEPDGYKWGGGNGRTTQTGALIAVASEGVDDVRSVSAGAAAHRFDPIVLPELHANGEGAILLGAFSLNGSGELDITDDMTTTQASPSADIVLSTAYQLISPGSTDERLVARDTSGGAVGQLLLLEPVAAQPNVDEGDQQDEPAGEESESGTPDDATDAEHDQPETGEEDESEDNQDHSGPTNVEDEAADDPAAPEDEADHDQAAPEDEAADEITGTGRLWHDPNSWIDGRVPSAEDHVTVSGHVVIDGDVQARTITVPVGSMLEYHPDVSAAVTVSGNVVIEGLLRMQPSAHEVEHVLRFVGIDETKMVGGHTDRPLDSDVGLWIVGDGVLHAEGTDKVGWNRTGEDPSWQPGDDIRVAPMEKGDTTTFAPFAPGSPVPYVEAANGEVHRAEVFNLTRNVRIEGGGSNSASVLEDNGRPHVQFLHCNNPQTIRNVELAYVGPRAPAGDWSTGIEGRYGLHFHMCRDGSRGSVVESVVIRDAGNSAFVPHSSHGITFRDTVSFSTYESAYWWDPGHETNDVLYDRAAAFRIRTSPDFRGYELDGFTLGSGKNMVVRDSVVVGSRGQRANAGGFHWPSSSNAGNNEWVFERNVAHNNRGAGISSWQNTSGDHVVADFVSYRNGQGVVHGAYLNSYTYRDGHAFENGADVVSKALSRSVREQKWERMVIQGDLHISSHALSAESGHPVVFKDLDLGGSVIVDEGSKQVDSVYAFLSTQPRFNLTADRFKIFSQQSAINVKNSDGSGFVLLPK